MNFFAELFDTSGFPARWNCGHWTSAHGWLHILSDLAIWSAYFAIPLVLGYFILQRHDLPFRKVFALFVAFILLCGSTHLMEAIIFWWPAYRLAGLIKLLTAAVSWVTVVALIGVVPQVVRMRTPEELEKEIDARKIAELRLQELNFELERRVEERTNELTQMVATLRGEQELLRTTLASIGDAVITTDTEARITNMNPVAESLTGWASGESVGRPLEAVLHIVNDETRREVENPAAKAVRTGAIIGLTKDTILIARDGTERPVDQSAAPIRSTAGEVVGCVLVFRDISARRRQEAELREQERQFRTLAESLPLLCWMANADGHVFWYNRRWYDYTGTSLEQMEGWGWQSVHDPEELPKVLTRWQASIATGEPFDMEFPLKGGDGRFRQFLTRVVPVKDDEGRVVRWFGTNTDIQQQKQASDELRRLAGKLSETDRHKDEFLATLAHELRNPLAPIRTGLQLLRLEGTDGAAAERTRTMMERQLTQLVRLVDDLMDVSRITRNKIELRKEHVEVASVVNVAVETSRPLIQEIGHELIVTLPSRPVFIDVDPTRLAQVFMNLLNNAAKYSNPSGRIWLTVEQHENDAAVSVRDTGVGIDAAYLPRIFEMFTQGHRSLEKSQGGLGVGLALVKRLVEMHGGRIEARSDGPGRGSEFIVRLPVVLEASRPLEPGEQSQSAPRSLRILIVDDNRDGTDSLGMMLQIVGNEIRTAYDGEEGMAAAREFRPDVALLDIGLPKLNGYELCRRIREQPWGERMILIAVTGWGQEGDRRRSHEAGFDRHMVKPVDPQALMKVLAGLRFATK